MARVPFVVQKVRFAASRIQQSAVIRKLFADEHSADIRMRAAQHTHSGAHEWLDKIDRDYGMQFWILQLFGWTGVAVFTFLSLTLYYNTIYWQHIVHTILQSIIGLAVTLPLRWIFKALWQKNVALRIFVTAMAVVAGATVWTLLRMIAFMWLDHKENLLSTEFGGWFYPSFFIFSCWAALYYSIKLYQERQAQLVFSLRLDADRREEHLKRLEAETTAKEAQLKMLRYQLNPHFLFNTLNAISALVHLKENSKAREMLVRLSEFLRFSLANDPKLQTSLEQELHALTLYLQIEQARFADRLSVRVEVTPEARRSAVPSLLLQPLIENAVKYGIANKEDGGEIKIQGFVAKGVLTIVVADDGPGFNSVEQTTSGRGVGLRNTRERLHLLYGDESRLDMRNRETGGAQVKLRIPHVLFNEC